MCWQILKVNNFKQFPRACDREKPTPVLDRCLPPRNGDLPLGDTSAAAST